MRIVPKIACQLYCAIATIANDAVENAYDNTMNMVDTKGPLKKDKFIQMRLNGVRTVYHQTYLTLNGMNGASNFKNTDGIEIASSNTPVEIGMQSRGLLTDSRSS